MQAKKTQAREWLYYQFGAEEGLLLPAFQTSIA
jgi:hypothetical protein